MKKYCLFCGVEFRGRSGRQFCSQACANKHHGMEKKKEEKVSITLKLTCDEAGFLEDCPQSKIEVLRLGIRAAKNQNRLTYLFKENLPYCMLTLLGLMLLFFAPLTSGLYMQLTLFLLGVCLSVIGVFYWIVYDWLAVFIRGLTRQGD